jgi:hypothetical protein
LHFHQKYKIVELLVEIPDSKLIKLYLKNKMINKSKIMMKELFQL